ncbi:hypothetical protein [Pedosphaera parvula]|nr:hypothetical protein [Pedosphaera parvula]
MKRYLSSQSKRFWLGLALCAAVVVLSTGCNRITSLDISGVYVRARDGVVDKIILAANGSFQQTITFTNGGPWTTSGSWKFNGATVELDTFYDTFDIGRYNNKMDAVAVIPPQFFASACFLEVQEGKLLRNSVEPIWIKQPSGGNGGTHKGLTH